MITNYPISDDLYFLYKNGEDVNPVKLIGMMFEENNLTDIYGLIDMVLLGETDEVQQMAYIAVENNDRDELIRLVKNSKNYKKNSCCTCDKPHRKDERVDNLGKISTTDIKKIGAMVNRYERDIIEYSCL